jgi:general secretion pathway protein A
MYAPFFGLTHPPFSIAPDPRYLFMSERHRDALAHLLYGLEAGGGFVLLTGEVGAGKTTVCRCFLEQIPPNCNVAYIFNPKLTVGELLRSICDEFGVPHHSAVPGVETVKDCIDPLNAWLLAAHAAGRSSVLIIDEAQNLAPDVLEQLRLLTNLETSERKLLQIILIGQPELRALVAQPSMEQLAQRVIARFHLGALTQAETQQYIAHRLGVAGLQGPLPFDGRAMQRVHALTHGVPRRINLLCDRALLGAYAAGVRQVSRATVERAAREVFDAPSAAAARSGGVGTRPPWAPWALGGLAGAVAVAGAGWAAGLWPALQAGGSATAATGRGASAAAMAPLVQTSAGAAAAAPAPLPAASAPGAPLALEQFMQAQREGEAAAWQTLAAAWGASLAAGADACTTLPREGLRCYRNRRAGLNLVRQIDRPVLLALYPSENAKAPVTVLLRSLEKDSATLEGEGQTLKVPLASLAEVWRGEIATLWRVPEGMPERGDITDAPSGTAWLDRQLAGAAAGGAGAGHGATPAQRQARIHRFQLAQGVVPDGLAGPLTLMLLNRVAGVSEPRLHPGG